MRHFPIFVDLQDTLVVVSGAGEVAVAKLRLLLKTQARIYVFGVDPAQTVLDWQDNGSLVLHQRSVTHDDLTTARLVYCANDEPNEDRRVADMGRAAGILVNVVDNLDASDFITPAIVDRDPVTVAIGTEGTAPVLARQIKAETEERISSSTGILARIGNEFRSASMALPAGSPRRQFWSLFFDRVGPQALRDGGEPGVRAALQDLLDRELSRASVPGHVSIIGAGPGDPDLLTMKARRTIGAADVIIHDRLVPLPILELARREALIIEVGKTPNGPSWRQQEINALLVEHAAQGAQVARLKSGDPAVYGRLDEEMDELDAAGISFDVIPGITSAAAAAAEIKVSLTRRHRNSSVRFLTGHDVDGFADQDWRGLTRPGATAAIYMGVRAARFLQGRLLMHGAVPDTPVTAIENVSRANQKVVATTLADLPTALSDADITGPAILFLGLSPRAVSEHIKSFDPEIQEAL